VVVSVSRHFGQTMKNLAEISHVKFLMPKYLNQRKVLFKKTTNMMLDPTVNRGAMAHPGHLLESKLDITRLA